MRTQKVAGSVVGEGFSSACRRVCTVGREVMLQLVVWVVKRDEVATDRGLHEAGQEED